MEAGVKGHMTKAAGYETSSSRSSCHSTSRGLPGQSVLQEAEACRATNIGGSSATGRGWVSGHDAQGRAQEAAGPELKVAQALKGFSTGSTGKPQQWAGGLQGMTRSLLPPYEQEELEIRDQARPYSVSHCEGL